MNRAGFDRWQSDYDAAGIVKDTSAPAPLRARVAGADVMVASDLPRAVTSASHLWPGKSVVVSPLFREAPLRIPSLGGARVPLGLWAMFIHLQWAIDIARRRDMTAETSARCAEAADWCVQTCRDRGPTVAVVTHGVFRRALANAFVARGWMFRGRRSYAPWSIWELALNQVDHGRARTLTEGHGQSESNSFG
jgi:broad specificity phosphatase PhoE